MFLEIWQSFRRMPLWVQLWVGLILGPVNLASLAFLGQPDGAWVAALAVGGMLPNLPILMSERGLSKRMALPHVVVWTPLIFVILATIPQAQGAFLAFLWILLVVDLISLGFDIPDAWKWWRGDRAIA